MTKMKNVYQKPEIEILEIDLQSMIATSVTSDGEGLGNGGESDGGMEAEGNRHRGEWGNLWSKN